jgi:hypothetical protein
LQKTLHDKAKGSPSFRFYALYDKVYRKDVPAFAYACCQANGGAAGMDGQSFEGIEEYGVERWWDELAEELRSRTYRAQLAQKRPSVHFNRSQSKTILILDVVCDIVAVWVLAHQRT